MSKEIKLTQGKFATVDDEDYPYLLQFKWRCVIQSTQNKIKNYRAVMDIKKSNGKWNPVFMEEIILKKKSEKNKISVLHKNKNTLDNRKENLKYTTYNHITHYAIKHPFHNGRKLTSKYKGVNYDKENNRFRSIITKDKIRYEVGSFKDEKSAAIAYNRKARELYGDLAYQNKIEN